jgi:hypothetical protein
LSYLAESKHHYRLHGTAHAHLRPVPEVPQRPGPQALGPAQYMPSWTYEVYALRGSSQSSGIEIELHGGGLYGFNAEMHIFMPWSWAS